MLSAATVSRMYGASLQKRLQAEAGLTNEVLGDEEMTIVRQLISSAEATLSHFKASKPRPSGHVAELFVSRVTDDIARFKVAIAPHKTLPSELLSHIFLLCLGDDPAPWPPNLTKPPWVFGYVCSRWRHVALGEPRLWDSLMVLSGSKEGSRSPPPSLNREVIARSNGNPLSLTLKGHMRTIDAISPLSQRIRSLQIKDTDPSFLLSAPPFHSLESIVLEFPMFDNGLWKTASRGEISVLDDAPRLRSLSLSYNDSHSIPLFSKNQFKLNWAQLTSLTLFQIAPDLIPVLDIIREAASLVEFYLVRQQGTFVGLGGNSLDLSPPPIHHNLQKLRLGLNEINDVGFFVQPLTLPSLRVFENSGDEIYGLSTLLSPELLTFLIRSGQSLRCFSLSGKARMPQMEETFRALHGVVELHLSDGYPIPASIFHSMRTKDLLPALEVLVCETLSVCAFVEFLETRISGLACPGIRCARIRGYEASLSTADIGLGDKKFLGIESLLKEEGREVSITIHDGAMSYTLGTPEEEVEGLFGFLGS